MPCINSASAYSWKRTLADGAMPDSGISSLPSAARNSSRLMSRPWTIRWRVPPGLSAVSSKDDAFPIGFPGASPGISPGAGRVPGRVCAANTPGSTSLPPSVLEKTRSCPWRPANTPRMGKSSTALSPGTRCGTGGWFCWEVIRSVYSAMTNLPCAQGWRGLVVRNSGISVPGARPAWP